MGGTTMQPQATPSRHTGTTRTAARGRTVASAAVALACLLLGWSAPATGVTQPAGTLPTESTAGYTPHVLDGRVNAVTQVGDTIILGGDFSSARNDTSQTAVTRHNLLAFSATTGQISTTFVPDPNNEVNAVIPAGDGVSVFVGGRYTAIGGVSRSRVARVRVSDGAVLGFDAGQINGGVNDLRLRGSRLWVGGAFTSVGNTPQRALATVDPDTGAIDQYMRLDIDGVHNGGSTNIQKIDITPDGSRLAAIGNFTEVEGDAYEQLVMLDLGGATAAIETSWRTEFYTGSCHRVFNTYMRDIDFSPDGSYFVIGTTGAYRGSTSPCDSVARFETGATGSDIRPSWTAYTGGDTIFAVEVGTSAVFIGGHQRWFNNPFAGDRIGPGAVSREGLAALDPINGLPFSWDPGRTRGVGVFDFLVTPQGLWVGSDTDRIANHTYHGRIALLLSGGAEIEAITNPTLPGDVYLAGQDSQNTLSSRSLTEAGVVGPPTSPPTGGINWNNVRGAFVINDQLYVAASDGSFTRRSYDGTTYGSPVAVDTHDQLMTLSAWQSDIENATGMFYDGGRIYFTRSGSNNLFYRYFTPENDVVGADRFVASGNVSGISFSQVRGMFGTGDRLYWSDSSGRLSRIDWETQAAHGVPLAGTATQVSGPGVDSVEWDSRALFLYGDTPVNTAPVASFTTDCTGLVCDFDASASTDPEGQPLTYTWSFGDGQHGSGETAQHAYALGGQFTATLTVSDGVLMDSTNRQVNPAPLGGQVNFIGSASAEANSAGHTVTVPSAVQPGDALVMFLTTNRTSTTVDTPTGWTLLESVDGNNVRGRAFTKTAGQGDAGSPVTVTLSGSSKANLVLAAYRSTTDAEISASAADLQNSPSASFTSPTVPVLVDGSRYVGFWAEKSTGAVVWTPDAALTVRESVAGSGGGKISSFLAEVGPLVPGVSGGFTATTDGNVNRGVMFSVVVAP